jgi:type IV pilus assembly protein PilC
MELYQYKAIDAQGKVLHGRANAVNVVDLEVRLKRMGLDLIRFRPIKDRHPLLSRQSIPRTELIGFFFHLVQLLEAGVPIRESLSDLRDSLENVNLREVTAAMIESIDGGKSLSESMRDFSTTFSPIIVSLIKAGEDSGQLTQVMGNIIENLKWQDEQAAHMKKLLMYPAFVAVVVSVVLFMMMTYLVPELLKFIQSMGQTLPLHTRILIAVSNAFVEYWYLFLSFPFLVIAGVYTGLKRSPRFRLWFDGKLLTIPLLGPLFKKLILARFSNYFAIMYASGITVLDCIRSGEEIVGNKAVEEGVRAAGRQIADGAGISASFQSTGLFPPLILRMLRVGENTGALEVALKNVGYFYTRDVRESIERLQTMIEPAMTVILGLIMGWIILSVLGPIYDLITKIKV